MKKFSLITILVIVISFAYSIVPVWEEPLQLSNGKLKSFKSVVELPDGNLLFFVDQGSSKGKEIVAHKYNASIEDIDNGTLICESNFPQFDVYAEAISEDNIVVVWKEIINDAVDLKYAIYDFDLNEIISPITLLTDEINNIVKISGSRSKSYDVFSENNSFFIGATFNQDVFIMKISHNGSLEWQTRTIPYCQDNRVKLVSDNNDGVYAIFPNNKYQQIDSEGQYHILHSEFTSIDNELNIYDHNRIAVDNKIYDFDHNVLFETNRKLVVDKEKNIYELIYHYGAVKDSILVYNTEFELVNAFEVNMNPTELNVNHNGPGLFNDEYYFVNGELLTLPMTNGNYHFGENLYFNYNGNHYILGNYDDNQLINFDIENIQNTIIISEIQVNDLAIYSNDDIEVLLGNQIIDTIEDGVIDFWQIDGENIYLKITTPDSGRSIFKINETGIVWQIPLQNFHCSEIKFPILYSGQGIYIINENSLTIETVYDGEQVYVNSRSVTGEYFMVHHDPLEDGTDDSFYIVDIDGNIVGETDAFDYSDNFIFSDYITSIYHWRNLIRIVKYNFDFEEVEVQNIDIPVSYNVQNFFFFDDHIIMIAKANNENFYTIFDVFENEIVSSYDLEMIPEEFQEYGYRFQKNGNNFIQAYWQSGENYWDLTHENNFNHTDVFSMKFSLDDSVQADPTPIPTPNKLSARNYPNPFSLGNSRNAQTTIEFNLPQAQNVDVSIYNIKGQKVKNLLNNNLKEGIHSVSWNGENSNNNKVSSGVYFYKIRTDRDTTTKKILMLK